MEPWLVTVTILLCAVPIIFIFGYRHFVSAEAKDQNRRHFHEWIHSNRRSAKFFRAFWWFLILCTVLHVLHTILKSQ